MFSIKRPSDDEARRFIAAEGDSPFSYPDVAASRVAPPDGYNVDHHRIHVGNGETAWRRATAAVRRWQMFNMPWVRLYWPTTEIREGAVVAICVMHFGFYSLNLARIVYIVDENPLGDRAISRFGFAYGTLAEHAESGEERFTVEWNRDDNAVSYEILAFSRPKHAIAKLAYPLSRTVQKRFAHDSGQAMLRAVSEGSE